MSQVPHESMGARRRGEPLWGPDPVVRNIPSFDRLLRWVVARIAPHHCALRIEDLERDRSTSITRQTVVEDRAIGGILARRFFLRHWRVGVHAPADPRRERWPKEMR